MHYAVPIINLINMGLCSKNIALSTIDSLFIKRRSVIIIMQMEDKFQVLKCYFNTILAEQQ